MLKVLFFYGLAGAGKTYVAKMAAKISGWYHYEGDNHLTPEIKEIIKKGLPFTQEARDSYFAELADKIIELKSQHQHLIVSQGAYKKKNRDFLRQKISQLKFICVEASPELIKARLLVRGDLISAEYAARLSLDFEPPDAQDIIIFNELNDAEIKRQLRKLL
jgi:carbohydrate kinase (thermoresistant glucokinase family)